MKTQNINKSVKVLKQVIKNLRLNGFTKLTIDHIARRGKVPEHDLIKVYYGKKIIMQIGIKKQIKDIAIIEIDKKLKPLYLFKKKQEAFNTKQESFNTKQEAFNTKQEAFNNKIDAFIVEQKVFNKNQEAFNTRQEAFNVNQLAFNEHLSNRLDSIEEILKKISSTLDN